MKDDLVIRSNAFSLRFDSRLFLLLIVLLLISLVFLILNVAQGEYPIGVIDIIKTLVGIDTNNPDHEFVIKTLRLPRSVVAWMVGVALATTGVIFQGLTRNPLADPSIIGINSGAGLAAVALIILVPNAPPALLPLGAFGGAIGMALVIYSLAWNRGSSPLLFILLGVGLSAVAGAFTSLMITFGQIYDVSQALVWLAGSVYGRSWEQLWAFLPWLVLGLGSAFFLGRQINVLHLGDEIAQNLGARVERERLLLVTIGTGLAAAAVATAGTIGFVGLMAPHLGRKLIGANHSNLLPISGLLGGILVTGADLLGRTLFAPIELPCGVVTATIGAPFFLYLLITKRR